jgi:two-component system cell cycle sensor histidine kinase PleC
MADFVGATFEAAEREVSRADAVTAKANAEAASQAKTTFLSSMSHELRTPLNAIIGFSEIMSEQAFGPLLPRYHDYVSDIHKSAEHLLHIINDVLDIARIESGKMTLYEEPVELRALVEDCFAFVRERAAKKDIVLDAHVPTAGVIIQADDSRIRQIILNLLSNAVKFTAQGGRVWIAVNRDDDDCVCITVGDTGIGMRPDEIPRALEPFRQVDSMLARSQEGSGLGLPISKNLAALHGASFVIDSAVGRGTVVTMTFPKERTLRPKTARAAAE